MKEVMKGKLKPNHILVDLLEVEKKEKKTKSGIILTDSVDTGIKEATYDEHPAQAKVVKVCDKVDWIEAAD